MNRLHCLATGPSAGGSKRGKLGQPLPTLPLWLDEDLSVPLDLEESYEETCRVLRIA